jgi:DNA mismatch repair protein MutL
MGIIKHLSPPEVQKIAAGQVVERPANVVKELVENALDAHATVITIYVQARGHDVIRVVDNGMGMDADDARTCFDNHATSKITTVHDLTTINTFGFRGEALASIAAVSKVELRTMKSDAMLGTAIFSAQAILEKTEPCVTTPGTDIAVHDLFFNVPARRKFLKKEESEWRVIVQMFQAFCLSYPEVHFQLFSDNHLMYNCPGTTSLKNRAIQVLDERAAQHMLIVEPTEDHDAQLSGIISNPQISRYNKNQIFFLINRRWIKNYQLTNALLKGYLNVLPTNRYPVGVITITIDPTLIDVNVDPRKEEIRFAHPRRIEQRISTAVQTTLEKHTRTQTQSMPSQQFAQPLSLQPLTNMVMNIHRTHESYAPPPTIAATTPTISVMTTSEVCPMPEGMAELLGMAVDTPLPNHQPIQLSLTHSETNVPSFQLVGILHNTYLLVQQHDGLVLVDQHAAHERVLFEQFAQRFGNPETIPLLFPVVISCTTLHNSLFDVIQQLLHKNGIEIDLLGPDSVMIRSTPAHLKHICFKEFLDYAFNQAQEHEHINPQEFADILNRTLQAQMACKAAVKAGDALMHEQAEQLLRDLYASPNCFTCPHGRPTSWSISIHELEKKFKRKS